MVSDASVVCLFFVFQRVFCCRILSWASPFSCEARSRKNSTGPSTCTTSIRTDTSPKRSVERLKCHQEVLKTPKTCCVFRYFLCWWHVETIYMKPKHPPGPLLAEGDELLPLHISWWNMSQTKSCRTGHFRLFLSRLCCVWFPNKLAAFISGIFLACFCVQLQEVGHLCFCELCKGAAGQ